MKGSNLVKVLLASALSLAATTSLANGWGGGHHGGGHHGGGDHGGGHHGGGHHGGGQPGGGWGGGPGGDHGGGWGNDDHNGPSWWSSRWNRWFDKRGYCGQYDYTDYETCNSPRDQMQCDWDHQANTCYSEHP